MEARVLVIGDEDVAGLLRDVKYDVQQADYYWADYDDDMICVTANVIIAADEKIDISFLRERTNTPLIVIGGGEELSVVAALLEGADDYVSRPVQPSELRARIKAKLRWAAHPT